MEYRFIRGSDVIRDGMYLELSIYRDGQDTALAEVFYSDLTGCFSLSCFEDGIPLPIMEELISRAKTALIPVVK